MGGRGKTVWFLLLYEGKRHEQLRAELANSVDVLRASPPGHTAEPPPAPIPPAANWVATGGFSLGEVGGADGRGKKKDKRSARGRKKERIERESETLGGKNKTTILPPSLLLSQLSISDSRKLITT